VLVRMTPRTALALTGVAAALVAALAGCGNGGSSGGSGSGAAPANTKVGILLPDTASSPRWVSADPTELRKQCTAHQLTCLIDNANGSPTTQQSQAQALINSGVGVLLVVNLDPGSDKSIEALAQQHNVVTIDYDRLTTGGTASYYVSYDNVKIGQDQGTALTQAPQVKGKSSVNYVEIDGAPTDNTPPCSRRATTPSCPSSPAGRSSPTRPATGTPPPRRPCSPRCSASIPTSTR
jgi:D-xylose transport system substrate-binding protein